MITRRRFLGLSGAAIAAAALAPLPVEAKLDSAQKRTTALAEAWQAKPAPTPMWVTPSGYADLLKDDDFVKVEYTVERGDTTLLGHVNGREVRLAAHGDYAQGFQRGMKAKIDSYFNIDHMADVVVASAEGKYMAKMVPR